MDEELTVCGITDTRSDCKLLREYRGGYGSLF